MILTLKKRKLSPRDAKELAQVHRAGVETEPKTQRTAVRRLTAKIFLSSTVCEQCKIIRAYEPS